MSDNRRVQPLQSVNSLKFRYFYKNPSATLTRNFFTAKMQSSRKERKGQFHTVYREPLTTGVASLPPVRPLPPCFIKQYPCGNGDVQTIGNALHGECNAGDTIAAPYFG